ncbi:MAG: glycosyltransferase family 4 protein [Pseudomonadota bacterium]
MTKTEKPAGSARHILVLAPNPFENDARIRKQIESLLSHGYVVTVLATREKGAPAATRTSDALHVYRLDEAREHTSSSVPVWLENDTIGPLGERFRADFAAFAEMRRSYDLARHAVKLARLLDYVRCLPNTRATRRVAFKDALKLMRDGMTANMPDSFRVHRSIYFLLSAWRFVEIDGGLKARIAQVGPPDLVHGHDLFTAPAAIEIARLYGAKAVYDAHEYEPERNPPMTEAQRAHVVELEDRVIARIDGLITVGRSIRDLYRERHPGVTCRLIFNCPEIRGEGGAVRSLHERAQVAADVPIIAYIGMVTVGSRGLQVTLDALQSVPDAVLAVIGPRRKQADAELLDAAERAGLSDRIRLLDPVAPNEVVPTIADATASVCLIQPTTLSYRFAQPNKLFESALAGVPVIGSDLPDIAAFLREFDAGLVVDQSDPSAIAEAMRAIIADRDAYVPTPEQRAALVDQYSWEAQERTLLDLYASLIDGDQAAGAAAGA